MSDVATAWAVKAVIASIGLGIFPLILGALEFRGLKNEITLTWWLLGTALGFLLLSKAGGGGIMSIDFEHFFTQKWKIMLVLVLGATMGLVMNLFYGQSILTAPNPAVAVAIIEGAILITYLAAPLVNALMPGAFPFAEVNWMGLFGVIVTILGITIVLNAH